MTRQRWGRALVGAFLLLCIAGSVGCGDSYGNFGGGSGGWRDYGFRSGSPGGGGASSPLSTPPSRGPWGWRFTDVGSWAVALGVGAAAIALRGRAIQDLAARQ